MPASSTADDALNYAALCNVVVRLVAANVVMDRSQEQQRRAKSGR
jgi:hypothetical protein